MINVDLSKAFHPLSFELLTPFLAGFVFDVSICKRVRPLAGTLGLRLGDQSVLALGYSQVAHFGE